MDVLARCPHRVRLDPGAAEAVRAALRQARRAEPCGYLLGRATASGWHVTAATAGRNTHPSPLAGFRLAPDEHLAVRRAARARGLRVVGTWHGHLVGPPVLGRADEAALSAGPLALMLVAARAPAGTIALRAYVASTEGSQRGALDER